MRPVFFYKASKGPSGDDGGWRWWISVWAPVAIAIGVICIESTETLSAQHTSSWLRPIFQRLFGPIGDSAWALFHHYLRKSGHFIGYGSVCLTFLRAWLHVLARRGAVGLLAWRLESCVLATFSTAIVASCDEFHQTLLPGRTGTPVDVLLDSTGACVFCVLVWVVCWMRRPAPEAG